MKILLSYGTNSGGTYFAAETVRKQSEERGHTVDLKEARELDSASIHNYDLTLFGSNTWFYNNKEGQPHLWYLNLEESFKARDYIGRNFAIFALGDSSYAQFAESSDYLENMIRERNGVIACPSLKIDRYYKDEKKNQNFIKKWTLDLLKECNKFST
ncbi:hypothetical protein A3H80_02485 [Candidatus Roizmanbacteria bacterium RIFCSPLOWO2_02_FULL_37_19]|nr:MAG: hypothetical protein A2862_02070 [Candidatus Roizmanbacteria bacterium RIFCSPHIGHO2_01_FULL_38_41]OGK32807.1 MAG: hypothetical protein A3E10_03395 [Candidatus Roizmanbacteria bacterium RIFCSPHIGHO2_12_FULL_37_23]OGK45169.1 MAG: hypothetical protein A2956_03175 [Candidatus Roizmanbacteria bacterium RIFCSPLOWO2_01_FULL_37_57]OGK53611.1 MAG: hypothetical protein A3H80_02485 [Candidatus Roizmanbacteria bacterium RIFCSPLOWO2_02_FULL_37_19]OGK61270.1 MAG: hypothetical protein A3G65_04035 [Can